MLDKCGNRRKLKGKRNLSDGDMERYEEVNKTVKKEIRYTKERWIKEKCKIIENNLHRNPKQAYATVNCLLKTRTETQQLSLKAGMGRC